ncbi:MAG: divalent-cation tolerance protein CutA [Dehalococcoidales bacterium]|nr:divalent-cation tolerance protein CutA [Dehalococcoidales bacterium]
MTKTKEPEHIVVFITVADEEEARLISRVLLKQKKAACINIIPGVNSLFWWQEKIDSAQESLLVIKTRSMLLDEITQLVKEIHSYDVPEIIALPIIGGNKDYLEWIDNETG